MRSTVRFLVAASVLAVGTGAAAGGAGIAGAAPGISYDNGSGPVGIGDQQNNSGAWARAEPGNKALAISVFRPAAAEAGRGAGPNPVPPSGNTGNVAIAVDGLAVAFQGNNNTAVVIGGKGAGALGNNNRVVAVNGEAVAYGDNNTLFSVGSRVIAGNSNARIDNHTVAAVCGAPVLAPNGLGSTTVEGYAGPTTGISCLP